MPEHLNEPQSLIGSIRKSRGDGKRRFVSEYLHEHLLPLVPDDCRLLDELLSSNDGIVDESNPLPINESVSLVQSNSVVFVSIECFEGRTLLSAYTMTQMESKRAPAGEISYASEVMDDLQAICARARDAGKTVIIFVSAHRSTSGGHRECKGAGFDREKAVDIARTVWMKMTAIFGRESFIHVFQVVLETDEQSVTFFGRNGSHVSSVALAEIIVRGQEDQLEQIVRARFLTTRKSQNNNLYRVSKAVFAELIALMRRCITRIKTLVFTEFDSDHRERAVFWSRRRSASPIVQWRKNIAFGFVATCKERARAMLRMSLDVMKENLDAGRIPGPRCAIVVCSPFSSRISKKVEARMMYQDAYKQLRKAALGVHSLDELKKLQEDLRKEKQPRQKKQSDAKEFSPDSYRYGSLAEAHELTHVAEEVLREMKLENHFFIVTAIFDESIGRTYLVKVQRLVRVSVKGHMQQASVARRITHHDRRYLVRPRSHAAEESGRISMYIRRTKECQ